MGAPSAAIGKHGEFTKAPKGECYPVRNVENMDSNPTPAVEQGLLYLSLSESRTDERSTEPANCTSSIVSLRDREERHSSPNCGFIRPRLRRRSPAISKLTATRLRRRTTTHLVDSIRYGTTDETIDHRLAAKRVTIRLAGWLVIQESSTLIRSVRARLPIPTRGSSQLASSDADSGARRASRSRAFTTVSTTGRSEEVL